MRRAVSRILPSRLSRHNTTHGSRESGSAGPDPEAKISSTFAPIVHSNFKIDLSLIADFYIAIDEPHKLWLPGDEISGQIILILRKNLANIAITLALNGYIKINASSHLKLRPVKHVLFNHTIKIYGGEEDISSGADNDIDHDPDQFQNGLYKGEHRFPFIVKLPNKRVYTSINFGKGSIAYLLKATIGNMQPTAPSTANSPTAASPTISASSQQLNTESSSNATSSPGDTTSSSLRIIAKAKLLRMLTNSTQTLEKLINIISPIDVAKLSPPKPKRLTLKDPRNSSRKLSRTQSSTSTINTFTTLSSNNSNTTETNRFGDQHREEANITTQQDDASSVNMSPAIGMLHPVTPSSDNSAVTPKPSVTSTTNSLRQQPDAVRVSLEISSLGYLRGELIPIKLNISHLKKIQDSNGIIITFLRVCRLENGSDGLFDSFRKDLYQLIIPLYVDPCTLKSEINTSVRVPADAFPTISGCPLVSFQYFIEVLINLSGKSIQFDGGDTNTSASNAKDLIIGAASNTAQVGSTFSFDFLQPQGSFNSKERLTYINTDKYKRMKKFLQLTSEVIVGTHRLKAVVLTSSNEDSDLYSQTSGRSLMLSGPQVTHPLPHLQQQFLCSQSTISPSFSTEHVDGMERTSFPGVTSFATPPYSRNNGPAPDYDASSPSASENLVPLPHQSATSEKEQMMIREASLMPSAPPLDDIEEDIGGVSPVDHNEDILQHIQGQGGPSQHIQSSTEEQQDGSFFINADRDIGAQPDDELLPQPNSASNDDSNNLYLDNDFVPKYELSGNDVASE